MIIEIIAKTIRKSGKTRYQISKDTGIDESVLCKIVNKNKNPSCGIKTADRLCKYLGLVLMLKKSKEKG
ncbi:MAG: helix-turn-helix transcriptional regulator [Lutibacter sp.]|jgi:DNA-binding phage protein